MSSFKTVKSLSGLDGRFLSINMAKWDAKNLEIRSKSVEQTLVPLVTQVRKIITRRFVTHDDRPCFSGNASFFVEEKKTYLCLMCTLVCSVFTLE